MLRSVVTGVGGYLPERVVTNDDLAKFVDTSDEWIVERTGIRQRHQVTDDQPVSDLAFEAAKRGRAAPGRTPAAPGPPPPGGSLPGPWGGRRGRCPPPGARPTTSI